MCSNAVSFGYVGVLQRLNLTGENMKNEGLTLKQLAERNAELVTEVEKLCAEREQLAAENVALKSGVAEEVEVINRGGQMYCVKDGMSINPIYARGWNDHRANVTAVQTPATDRIVAGIKADGAKFIFQSILDNPAVTDLGSLVDWLEQHANDSAAAVQALREGNAND